VTTGPELTVTEQDGAVRFTVRVQPRSSRLGIVGLHGTSLKICVHAPPVDGAANDEVIEVLADALKVPRRSIRIVSGEGSRNKVVAVNGMTSAILKSYLTAQ
jgi:uncharacterized protein (TIGR00251 family)